MMKNRHTTSAEKAVVLVFIVAMPLGFTLGYNFKQVPEPVVEEKIVVRTVNVGDYEWAKEDKRQGGTDTNTNTEACSKAVQDFEAVRDNLGEHEQAVAVLEPIIERLYNVSLGAGPSIGDLNEIRSDLGLHRREDWTRLSADNARLNTLQASINQCAGITNEGE